MYFLAIGTAVARFPLRQLGFLVISANCSLYSQWRILEFEKGVINLLLPSTPPLSPSVPHPLLPFPPLSRTP